MRASEGVHFKNKNSSFFYWKPQVSFFVCKKKGVPYVMSTLGKGKFYNTSTQMLIELLADPTQRTALDPYILDLLHIETITDQFSDSLRPQINDANVKRHDIIYCAWEVPADLRHVASNEARDSVQCISVVEGPPSKFNFSCSLFRLKSAG